MTGEIDSKSGKIDPVITVVMAAYNAEAYIARAIQSVQAQSFTEWELICINDGSTDNTQSIIQSFADHDERIKLISQANAGPAEARRKGYITGGGEYYIMLDSDDWFEPAALERLHSEAQETGADAVICRAMLPEAVTEGWVSFHERRGTMQGRCLSGQEAFALTFPWKIHGIALWRREVIKSIAIDRDNAFNRFNADEYLTRKLFLHCKMVLIGSGEYFICQNKDSITRKRSWRHFLSLETDRRLTDLALQAGVPTDILRNVFKHQRQNLLGYIARFSRYGGDGKSRIALQEIWESILHYLGNARQIEGSMAGLTLIFSILKHALRSFMGRFSVLRKLYHRFRPQS
jgi:glycosyltransferase involved in cell wall biosynthesis